jgi:hypothetical protein
MNHKDEEADNGASNYSLRALFSMPEDGKALSSRAFKLSGSMIGRRAYLCTKRLVI